MFWVTALVVLALGILRLWLGFLRHRRLSRKIGLNSIEFPIPEFNPLYMAIYQTRLIPYIANNWLPDDIADYIYNSTLRYRWRVKDRVCRKYGAVYLLTTPGSVSCHVSDASVAWQIFKARQGFPKLVKQYEIIAIYGSNVVTSEGNEWLHHRRYTASSFNDKNNALVWETAIRQATEMLGHWEDQHSQINSPRNNFVLPKNREDMFRMGLNVLCSAVFGVQLPFTPATEGTAENMEELFRDARTPPPGYHFTFRSAIDYVDRYLSSIFLATGILPRLVSQNMTGPLFKTDLQAYEDLGKYFRALIAGAERSESHKHNLLEQMVSSRREERQKVADAESRSKLGFSDEEILGNLYIFTVGGHESVATTLRYALVLLALHQDIQDELYQGIQEETRDEPLNPAEWDYARVYPKLVTPLCVMLETLRLYPPAVTLLKATGDSPVNITYNDQTYQIPGNIPVLIDVNGLHYSEEYWGPDAATFSPRRWDKRNRNSFLAKNDGVEGLSGPGLEADTIHRPVRGSYVPFSDGARACTGKKFAQVEFVAALAVIFREYRVMLARDSEAQTDEEGRGRAERALEESSSFITLWMGGEVPLLFEKRSQL